jgi:hypothetical protein
MCDGVPPSQLSLRYYPFDLEACRILCGILFSCTPVLITLVYGAACRPFRVQFADIRSELRCTVDLVGCHYDLNFHVSNHRAVGVPCFMPRICSRLMSKVEHFAATWVSPHPPLPLALFRVESGNLKVFPVHRNQARAVFICRILSGGGGKIWATRARRHICM